MKRGNKKAQVTLFILIAIAIFAVLLVLFYPRIKVYFAPTEPVTYVDECLMPEVEAVLEKVSMQGGSVKPTLYLSHEGNNIEYLCYTNLYYKSCVMQQPLLKQHVEREIKDYIEAKAKGCIQGLKEEMEKRGYNVNAEYESTDVRIVPNNINIIVNAKVSLTKEGTQSFNKFDVTKKSKLYNLIILSATIMNFETRAGDIDTLSYMLYYPNLRLEKLKQSDGSKIFILTDRNTPDKFMFATRSFAFPGGHRLSL